MLIAVNYHYVRPTFEDPQARGKGIQGVTPALLEAQLRLLGSGATFVSAEQVRDAVVGQRRLPAQAILVTFDDGLREQYVHALPVLTALGIPAVFFVNTLPIANRTVAAVHKVHLLRRALDADCFAAAMHRYGREEAVATVAPAYDAGVRIAYPYDPADVACMKYWINFVLTTAQRDLLVHRAFAEFFGDAESVLSEQLYMDVTQIRALGLTRNIGSHAHDHLPLGLLMPQELDVMIHRSMTHLEEWTGYRPFALSYPYGSYLACSRNAGLASARHGIVYALTMERAGNRNLDHPLHLARYDCNDLPGGKHPVLSLDAIFDAAPTARWYRD